MPRLPLKLINEAGITRRTLLIFTIITAILNGLVTALVTSSLQHSYQMAEARRTAIKGLATLLYERRINAGLVISSIRRNAELDEIRHRKRGYDGAFVDWNKHIRDNLFAIREAMGEGAFSSLEQDFEKYLVDPFSKIDGCVTRAYDLRISGQDALKELETCRMAEYYQLTLDCGATFTNELYKVTSVSIVPFMGPRELDRAAARARIGKACSRPTA